MENTPTVLFDLAAATDTSPKLHPQVVDHAIEQYIRAAGSFLEEARINPDVAEGLNAAGYDDEELSYGLGLQEAAWNAFSAFRSETPAPSLGAGAELNAKVERARDEFAAFRLVARACFLTLDARMALRVMGDVPEDLQRFINVAHAGYTTAAGAPFAEKMSKRGYPIERLSKLSEEIDALAALEAAIDVAEDAAEGHPTDTESRDQAYVALKDYMKEIRGVARAVFRKEPDTLAKLGL